jgi:hypothetical protein
MSEAKESESQSVPTEGSPLYVVATKTFPSGAKLTKATVDQTVCYIREAAIAVSKFQSEQILELWAPDWIWDRCAQVIKVEDSLKRDIRRNPDFTPEWAEGWLASG